MRPKRNHAGRPRRMQEVAEEPLEEPLQDQRQSPPAKAQRAPQLPPIPSLHEEKVQTSPRSSNIQESKNKSRSLDVSFRAITPPSSVFMNQDEDDRKSKSKPETDVGFLSRLFGSKRSKGKSSPTNRQEEEYSPGTKPHGVNQEINQTGAQLSVSPVSELKTNPSFSQDIGTNQPRISPVRSKPINKARAPPPPPCHSPPEHKKHMTHDSKRKKSVSKSQSFRELDSVYGEPGYPSLPTQHVPNNDIILKKNKSMSSVLENDTRLKFQSSIENWSYANEGLKKSIYSLADHHQPMPSSHSNESLKTITSLLEEPDVLVQTRVSNSALIPNQEEFDFSRRSSINPQLQAGPGDRMSPKSYSNPSNINPYYDVIFDGYKDADLLKGQENYKVGSRQDKQHANIDQLDELPGAEPCNVQPQGGAEVYKSRLINDVDSRKKLDNLSTGFSVAQSTGNKSSILQNEEDALRTANQFHPEPFIPARQANPIIDPSDVFQPTQSLSQTNSETSVLNKSSETYQSNFQVDPLTPSQQEPTHINSNSEESLQHSSLDMEDEQDWENFEMRDLSIQSFEYPDLIPASSSGQVVTRTNWVPENLVSRSTGFQLTPEIVSEEREIAGKLDSPPTSSKPKQSESDVKESNPLDQPYLDRPILMEEHKLSPRSDPVTETLLPSPPLQNINMQVGPDLLSREESLGREIVKRSAEFQTDMEKSNLYPNEVQSKQEKDSFIFTKGGVEKDKLGNDPTSPLPDQFNDTKECVENIDGSVSTEPQISSPELNHETLDIHVSTSPNPEMVGVNESMSPCDESSQPCADLREGCESIEPSDPFKPNGNCDNTVKEYSMTSHIFNHKEIKSTPASNPRNIESEPIKLAPGARPTLDNLELDSAVTETTEKSVSPDPDSHGENNKKLSEQTHSNQHETSSALSVETLENDEPVNPENKRPQVSPKPVPAPRHFFLKPVSSPPSPPGQSIKPEENELENVFARRSKSIRSLRETKAEETDEKDLNSFSKRSKSARNLGEIKKHNGEVEDVPEPSDLLINVKERAKSFSGSQNLHLAPKPYRPVSIVQEIQLNKPLNIPPKPKLAIKPVPAPRQFRSLSGANIETVKPERNGSRSASDLLQGAKPEFGNKPHAAKIQDEKSVKVFQALEKPEQTVPSSWKPIQTVNQPTRSQEQEKKPAPQAGDSLEDIHVRKIVKSLQTSEPTKISEPIRVSEPIKVTEPIRVSEPIKVTKPIRVSEPMIVSEPTRVSEPIKVSEPLVTKEVQRPEKSAKSPDKPVRRSIREKSVERTQTDSNCNVMSIVSRLNALSM